MTESDMNLAERMVEQIYEKYQLEFPIHDPRKLIPLFGGEYNATASYKIENDDAAVIKHKQGFTIAVCEPGLQYDIDLYQKVETDYLVCRSIGQLFLVMGYDFNPRKWRQQPPDIYPYKNLRYAKYRMQTDYFAHAFMLPKRVFMNSIIEHTKMGYEHGVDVLSMASDLNTTPQRVMERGKQLNYYIRDISHYGGL